MPICTLLPVSLSCQEHIQFPVLHQPTALDSSPQAEIHEIHNLHFLCFSMSHNNSIPCHDNKLTCVNSPTTSCKTIQAHQFLTNHWHHPHVEASEHLFFWTSDAAIQKHTQLLQWLSPADIDTYDIAVSSLIASSTHQVYGAGLMEWISYCDSCQVPEDQHFPTEPHCLQAFIASCSGTIGTSELNNILSILALWHHIHELLWDSLNHPLTRHFKCIAIDHAPLDSVCAPHPPITTHHLDLLLQCLNLNDPFDTTVWATACCTFWCYERFGPARGS